MSTKTEQNLGRSARSWKNFWINPKFQKKYVFWVTFSGVLLVAVNSGVFYFFTKENYDLLVELSPMTDDAKAQLYRELWWIIGCLVSGNLFFIALVALVGVVFSHKAAGPMYGLVKTCERIREGDVQQRVRFRPGDDFQEVAMAVNEMLDVLTQQKSGKKE